MSLAICVSDFRQVCTMVIDFFFFLKGKGNFKIKRQNILSSFKTEVWYLGRIEAGESNGKFTQAS